MAINKISGNILADNLQRGANLSIQGNLFYVDVVNTRLGVNTSSPTATLTIAGNTVISTTLNVSGNATVGNLQTSGGLTATGGLIATGNITGNGVTLAANTILAASGKLALGSNANILITGGSSNYVLTTDGTGNLSWSSAGSIGVIGNSIPMGTNSLGNLVSNAVTLTTATTVTDGITQLNTVLGKLVPASPPNFPNNTTLSITTATSSGRMCNFVQTDNTPAANKSVAGGTVVSVVRGSSYTTNTITNTGPGDTGTLTVYLNGTGAGNVTFNTGASPSANGTYGNLVVTNNYDYNTANANIAAGFWYVFSSRASGTVTQGWNEVYLADTAAGNTNTPSWYYDAAAPGTPVYSNVSVTACASPSLSYSSTIPHYNSGTQFGFGFSVNKLSGDLYPNNGNLLTNSTAAGGAFQAPASVTYASANVTVPLTRNLYVSSGTATGNTTANIVASGFGSSSTGPSVTVTNSYNSASQAFTTALAATVLYKNGNSTAIDEGNVVVTSVGTGSGNAFRIINPGAGNTPTYTGNASAFNSQSSTLQTYDATVVGSSSQGVLKHDQTNYATGYLPAGPNLSSGRSGTQYFTFKFVRTDVSKFDITYAGNVAGMWVALPGSVIDASSSANGWINMTQAYGGAGYPGVNSPGNGSDGCSLGGAVTPNLTTASVSKTCTFGTVSSSSTATNEIYVRIALTSGQSVTGLSLKAASN